MSLSTITAVSRSLGRPVVDTLSAFPQYQGLSGGMQVPTDAELLSQIADMDLLAELQRRHESFNEADNLAREYSLNMEQRTLTAFPHSESVRLWLDAIDNGELRSKLAKDAAIAPQNLSAQISANRLSAELAIAAARIAGVGLANGLVVAGHLTPREAYWQDDARELALSRISTSCLASVAANRLEILSRTLRKSEDEQRSSRQLWEHLG